MGKAYVVADIEVLDAEAYEDYKRLSSAAVDQHGGRWLVRGGDVTVLEGDRQPHRTVVLEFDDAEAARRWYDSPEYAEARAVRQRAARSSLVIVEGV
jgi:uncharacterized protein (DUF1330 family)